MYREKKEENKEEENKFICIYVSIWPNNCSKLQLCLAVCLKAGQGRYSCNIIEFRFCLNCHLGQKKLVGYFGHSL